jgi:ElaB/YqjD/DUF883 family membrane-anchored ribosome-binding protein
MSNNTISDATNNLIDQAAHKADAAIHATQRVTNEALDGLSHTIDTARQQVVPMIHNVENKTAALVQHGVDSVKNTSRQIRDGANNASDRTVAYIREEPVKSVLIAAATGAAVVALARVISQSRHHD